MATDPAPSESYCPDPALHAEHAKHDRDSEAAHSAAMLATKPSRSSNSTSERESPLGSDGKLSSRSAATSLKYAQPQDLPSFPSKGSKSRDAGAAAMLAKDHKMQDLWEPHMSAAGSKAAVLAAKDGGKLDLWQPSASSAGNKAATLAMREKGLSPEIDRGYTDVGRTNSMLAATKSQSNARQRAGSMPVPAQPPAYPDSKNSSKNALNAATVSHRASTRMAPDGWNSEANQAARVKNLHMDRNMFGEHPMVQPEVEEKQRQAALRASAVSMAKQMYDYQARTGIPGMGSDDSSINEGSAGARTAHARNQSSTSPPDVREEAIRYIHLQDAATKLAQERLAKVEKEREHERYREYYGYPDKSSPKKSRQSVRGRGRKRASSEGQYFDDSDDEEQARRIRTQMSQLNTGLNTVDNKQRSDDRARLMAAAEKRVHDRMHDMDEKVFLETGKPSQAMMEEWEAKARAKAEQNRQERDKHPGKTHIGGGKYMDQSEIEAIAAARLKPTFDELNDTAEKKRARDEEFRAQADKLETERMERKMKDQETKAEFKRIKEQDKAAARREKEERKAAERAEKEEARVRKSEDKRKSREQKRDEVAAVAGGAALAEVAEKVKEDPEVGTTPEAPAEAPVEVPDEAPREVASEEAREAPVVVPVVVPVEAPVEPPVEAPREAPPKAARTPPRETPREEPKEKASGRGMFGRLADRFKKRGDEDKQADEPEKVAQPVEREVKDPEPSTAAVIEHPEKLQEDPAVATGGTLGLWVPASAVEDDHAVQEEGLKRSIDSDGDGSQWGEETATAVGAAALGAIVAAGAVEVEHAKKEEADQASEVSNLSTEDVGPDNEHLPLAEVASAEHTGDYNFASPSPGVEKRPDIYRHVTNIESSSGSEPESDELTGSDDEGFGGLEPRPTMVGEPHHQPADVQRVTETLSRDAPLVSETVPGAAPVMVEDRPTTPEKRAATPQERLAPPESPVSPLRPEEEGMTTISNEEAPSDAAHIVVAPQEPSPESARPVSAESGAPAPAVKTGPRQEEAKRSSQPKEDKQEKGLRGFFRKLKSKSKADNKLTKSRSSSTNPSEKSFQGGSKYTGITGSKDETITPVTTTSAGQEAEKVHMGTDGPIGDSHHVSGIGGDPRPESPSSFERHNEGPNDLDDVSSSGADEEDVARGRTGRMGRTPALGQETSKTTGGDGGVLQTITTNGEDEQFEEARDHFDESLAPPPAFGGQQKSESPVRETRFQEQL